MTSVVGFRGLEIFLQEALGFECKGYSLKCLRSIQI